MQSPFLPGDVVSARGALWRLRDLSEHRDCVELDLSPAAACAPGHDLVLLHPFDRVARTRRARPRRSGRARFWHAIARRLLALEPCDLLAAPAAANLDLLPFQLEPAVASVLEGAARVLLADAVGLGKTIQAGLLLAELFVRGEASRALVLVPPSLRDQWGSELRDRFGLEAGVVDGGMLATLASRAPRLVNPWSAMPIAIVSIDFAKRPEVREALADVRWDVLVVDEAHQATRESDRFRVVQQVGERAGRVVLITATPHSGHDGEYAALTRLGAAGPEDPLVIFRRSRRDVGWPADRRTRRLGVRPGAAERAALRLLAAYARELWLRPGASSRADARLVAILLLKRASSTPHALQRTITRRRALLLAEGGPLGDQPSLPFDDAATDAGDEVPEWLLAKPGLATMAREVEWLDQIEAAAAQAACQASKPLALIRWLRRLREPCIVFSEYRDTIDDLERKLAPHARCVTLHGGQAPDERRAALRRFTLGDADVLLATDAAGTGLNLHHRCRAVVHFEPPWNPVRLEQRAGRVDRIGQARRVHVLQLYARGTPDARLLARVAERARRAGAALGDPTETPAFGPRDEEALAETWLGLRATAAAEPHARPGAAAPGPRVLRVDLRDAAGASARDARLRRLLAGARGRARPLVAREPEGPPVRTARSDRRRGGMPDLAGQPGAAVAVFQLRLLDWRKRLVDEQLLVVRAAAPWLRARGWEGMDPGAVAGGFADHPDVRAAVTEAATRRLAVVRAVVHRRLEASQGRWRAQHERHVRRVATDAPYQAGLFERRAARAAAGRAARTEAFGAEVPPDIEPETELVTLVAPPELCGLWLPWRP